MRKCSKCGKVYDDSWKVCLHCQDSLVDNSNSIEERVDDKASVSIKALSNGKYYNVSIPKLIILSVCTLGLYEIFWHYKNWKSIKEQTGEDISPFWRAWFLIFTCHELFKRIGISSGEKGLSLVPSAGRLATLYILLLLFGYIGGRLNNPIGNVLWIVSLFTVVPLISVQKFINSYNATKDPSYIINNRYGWESIVSIIVGGIFLILTIIGIFLPA